MIKIELLAPAKNYEYGVAAINAGADAIYIGAPKFGARHGATNSLEDIERLTNYAHLFGVKVFVTLNTVLFDSELDSARDIAVSLSRIGVDALIVQDMAYLMFGLDIPLHASTQAAALTPEKVLFYQEAGFERVILERAMSIDDFKAIRKETTVELEAFVHGAICVSYSGQCYMGQAISGRSGNRGTCSQPCRSTYNLIDEKENVIIRNKHLLSLLDLNLSSYIPQIIDSGITSFKIEGRLKDISYLKNSVAHYRKKLDEYISSREDLIRSSDGISSVGFIPNPINTFSRRFTSYFIEGKKDIKFASLHTAKALGQEIGKIERVDKDSITIKSDFDFSGGDGVCYIDKWGNFGGTNINSSRRDGDRVVLYPNVISGMSVGAMIYRNSDKKYIDEVTSSKVVRKVDARIVLTFSDDRKVSIKGIDVRGTSVHYSDNVILDEAKNVERAIDTFKTQLSKSGDTIYNITDVEIIGEPCFMSVSTINNIRRELLDNLQSKRLSEYNRNEKGTVNFPVPYCDRLSYKANVTNRLSREFYSKCGYKNIEEGIESRDFSNYSNIDLMTTRYCVRKEIGECLLEGGKYKSLYIENNGSRFELKFDCVKCEMKIIKI